MNIFIYVVGKVEVFVFRKNRNKETYDFYWLISRIQTTRGNVGFRKVNVACISVVTDPCFSLVQH